MGYFSNLDIDNQEMEAIGVIVPQHDQEPDAKEYMKTDQYLQEFDKAFGNPKQQIDDMIESLGGEA